MLHLFPKVWIGIGTPTLSSISVTTKQRFSGEQTSQTATGTGFGVDTQIRFDGVPVTTVFNSPTSLTYTIPESVLWTTGTKVVTAVNPAGGTSGTKNYTVTQHTKLGCELNPAGIVTSSGTVSQWTNAGASSTVSGNAGTYFDFVGSGAGKPVYAAAGLNGMNCVEFQTDSHLLDASASAGFAAYSDCAIYQLIRPSSASSADNGIRSLEGIQTGRSWLIGGSSGLLSGETWVIGMLQGGTNYRLGTSTTDYSWSANEIIVEELIIPSGGGVTLTKNGTAVSTSLSAGSGASTKIYTPSAAALAIGSATPRLRGNASPSGTSVRRSHFLMFDGTLTSAERTQVRKYLGSLGGVTVV